MQLFESIDQLQQTYNSLFYSIEVSSNQLEIQKEETIRTTWIQQQQMASDFSFQLQQMKENQYHDLQVAELEFKEQLKQDMAKIEVEKQDNKKSIEEKNNQLKQLVQEKAKQVAELQRKVHYRERKMTAMKEKNTTEKKEENQPEESSTINVESALLYRLNKAVSIKKWEDLSTASNSNLPSGSALKKTQKDLGTKIGLNELIKTKTEFPIQGLEDECIKITTPGEKNIILYYINFYTRLEMELKRSKHQLQQNSKIWVKISGDGRAWGKTSSVLIAFSFPQIKNSQSDDNVHVISIAEGVESYETLEKMFKDINEGIKKIEDQEGKIKIDDHTYEIEFFFVADLKFMLLSLGLASANGTHVCPICVECKHRRHLYKNQTKNRQYKDVTLIEFGQCKLPLIRLPPENIIIDELHLVLRIGEVLLTRLVKTAIKFNCISALHMEFSRIRQNLCYQPTNKNRDGIRCSSFKKDEHLRWMAKILPANIFKEQEVASQWASILDTFLSIYEKLVSDQPNSKEVEKCAHSFQQQLLRTFIVNQNKTSIFLPNEITPYIHLLVKHSASMVERVGSLKHFSCSSLERRNLLHAVQYFNIVQRSKHQMRQLLVLELITRKLKVFQLFFEFI
jgi:hypothetical protein